MLASPEELLAVIGPSEAVKVGDEVIHVVRVRNLDAEPLSQLQLRVRLGEGLAPVAATGPSPLSQSEGGLTADLATLDAGQQAEWRIVSRPLRPGETRIEAELVGVHFFCPLQRRQTLVAQ